MLPPAFCSTAAASEMAMASPLEANSPLMLSDRREVARTESASATAAVTSTVVPTSLSARPNLTTFTFAIFSPTKIADRTQWMRDAGSSREAQLSLFT